MVFSDINTRVHNDALIPSVVIHVHVQCIMYSCTCTVCQTCSLMMFTGFVLPRMMFIVASPINL